MAACHFASAKEDEGAHWTFMVEELMSTVGTVDVTVGYHITVTDHAKDQKAGSAAHRPGYEEIKDGPRAGKPPAIVDDGERLTEELRAALVDADDERLAAVAVPWSQITGLRGANPDRLAPWLSEFAKLACRARDKGEWLYCWVGV
jgi:hypothetical protein